MKSLKQKTKNWHNNASTKGLEDSTFRAVMSLVERSVHGQNFVVGSYAVAAEGT